MWYDHAALRPEWKTLPCLEAQCPDPQSSRLPDSRPAGPVVVGAIPDMIRLTGASSWASAARQMFGVAEKKVVEQQHPELDIPRTAAAAARAKNRQCAECQVGFPIKHCRCPDFFDRWTSRVKP